MQSNKVRPLLRFSFPLLFLIVFTLLLNKAVISNPQNIQNWLSGFGGYAIITYIVIQVLAIIIAPIGGSAFALAILALFGPFKGTILIYLVTTPAYVVNFLLARKYGKKVVHRLAGAEGEVLIDRFMPHVDIRKLILAKLFLGGYFDFIAYGVGLSNIKLKDFLFINITAGIPAAAFTWTVMRFAPSFVSAVAILYIVPAFIAVAYIGHSRLKKKKIENAESLLEHEI